MRHAQLDHNCEIDRTQPLTEEGLEDSKKVTVLLKSIKVDCYFSSPYVRSFDTIRESAGLHGIEIITDQRFREREMGGNGNSITRSDEYA